jgi:hypothetical protein
LRPDERFLRKPKAFWASVRTISQQVGYTQRGTGRIKVPDLKAMQKAFRCCRRPRRVTGQFHGTLADL